MVVTLGETFLWAMREFVSARLGDARLRSRLAKLVAAFTVYPNGSLPRTFSDWGSLKAAYRLIVPLICFETRSSWRRESPFGRYGCVL